MAKAGDSVYLLLRRDQHEPAAFDFDDPVVLIHGPNGPPAYAIRNEIYKLSLAQGLDLPEGSALLEVRSHGLDKELWGCWL